MMTADESAQILAGMIDATGDTAVVWVRRQNRTITWKLEDGEVFQVSVKAVKDPDFLPDDDD